MNSIDFSTLNDELTEPQLAKVRDTIGEVYLLAENLPHISSDSRSISFEIETDSHGLERETKITPILATTFETEDDLNDALLELDTRIATGNYSLNISTLNTTHNSITTLDADYNITEISRPDPFLSVEFESTVYKPPLKIPQTLCGNEQAVADTLNDAALPNHLISTCRNHIGRFSQVCIDIDQLSLDAILYKVETRHKQIIITPIIKGIENNAASAISDTLRNKTEFTVAHANYQNTHPTLTIEPITIERTDT